MKRKILLFVALMCMPFWVQASEDADELYNQIISRGHITLQGVYFEFGSARLTPESSAALSVVVEVLERFDGARFEIAGHTDSDGDEDYNLKLSRKRAETVQHYLEEATGGRNQLVAIGYGESLPLVSNYTSEGRAINRRVELKVLSYAGATSSP